MGETTTLWKASMLVALRAVRIDQHRLGHDRLASYLTLFLLTGPLAHFFHQREYPPGGGTRVCAHELNLSEGARSSSCAVPVQLVRWICATSDQEAAGLACSHPRHRKADGLQATLKTFSGNPFFFFFFLIMLCSFLLVSRELALSYSQLFYLRLLCFSFPSLRSTSLLLVGSVLRC
ncbi:hypothetical protein BC943DRAFT_146550 [Umbelopsis sp. AD052]|nr:hypothetical protein BC943DRAFT_146550 [Umbelopsis sp. AD052]